MTDTSQDQQQPPPVPAPADPLGAPKRLIVCCDGTWMNSLGEKSGEPQSNVTRISRIIRRTCRDGTHQVIAYNAGVGSGNALDKVTGGMFGSGLEGVIRETYNFICANYVSGDDIILIGYSRGAFTARSVADMIASLGLLTPSGLDYFHAIFEDYEHMGDVRRSPDDFLCDDLPPYAGQKGEDKIRWTTHRKDIYRRFLKSLGYTRDTHRDGVTPITIKALAVWDTVGTLGVPPAPIVGLWKFTNTEISDKVENAFQALGLDEPRFAFRPALWERVDGNRTNLKQVWFPGNHGGVGGGWHDQHMATISLAWMCDQLSTVGVEFSLRRASTLFMEDLAYSSVHPFPVVPAAGLSLPSWATFWRKNSAAVPLPWGNPDVCRLPEAGSFFRDEIDHAEGCIHATASPEEYWKTSRAWGLGQIRAPTSKLQTLAGTTVRHPGMFMRADYETNGESDQPLRNTSERIHSSVRVRLACGGLGLDDRAAWTCEALTSRKLGGGVPLWRLEPGTGLCDQEVEAVRRFRPREFGMGYPEAYLYPVDPRDGQWKWVFASGEGPRWGDKKGTVPSMIPQATVLPEEPLTGYWERYLLSLLAGHMDVWRYAEGNPPVGM